MILLPIGILLVGFVILIKGADFLVDGASSLAKRFGFSNLVIGLTVVAFGTSAPELFVNIISALNGSTDLAIGNIVGSNIANILLILGATAAIYPVAVKKGTVWKEIPLSVVAAVSLLVLINDSALDGGPVSVLTRVDGLVLLLFFSIFIYYTFGISKASGDEVGNGIAHRSTPVITAMLIGGLVGLVLGGKFIVDNATILAASLGLSERVIGISVVALGTSLPELATSIVAARKKQTDIAVGNVIGSNLFNLWFVIAITSTIRPLPISPGLNSDIFFVIIVSVGLFLAMFVGRRHVLTNREGVLFLFAYMVYIAYLFGRG